MSTALLARSKCSCSLDSIHDTKFECFISLGIIIPKKRRAIGHCNKLEYFVFKAAVFQLFGKKRTATIGRTYLNTSRRLDRQEEVASLTFSHFLCRCACGKGYLRQLPLFVCTAFGIMRCASSC